MPRSNDTNTENQASSKKIVPTPVRDLYPLDEGCQKLGGIGRATVYRWEKANKIRVTRIGGRVFIPASEIARLSA